MVRIIFTLYILFYGFTNFLYSQHKTGDHKLEKKLIDVGLVNIQEIDSTIKVDLRYSSLNNFLNADVYGDLSRCYLRKEAALKLAQAQRYLKQKFPGHSLLIFDGARPRSVQYKMWEIFEGPDKQKYVANPQSGSIHNYGAAVDLTIVDDKGNLLDMGTEFDFFGKLAQPRYEEKFLKEGKLNEKQLSNRKLLREAMTKAGFQYIQSEWWHFNAFLKDVVKKKYSIIE